MDFNLKSLLQRNVFEKLFFYYYKSLPFLSFIFFLKKIYFYSFMYFDV